MIALRPRRIAISSPGVEGKALRGKMGRLDIREGLADPRKRYQARHMAKGLCIFCPRPLADGSSIFCAWHQQKTRDRKRRLRGPILCRRCHKPLGETERGRGRRLHRPCLQACQVDRVQSPHYRQLHASAARAYQRRHEAQGLCTNCPRPAVPGKHVCARHLHYRQERYRQRKALRRGS